MANCANLFGECNYFSTVFERGFPLPKQTHCIIELDISHSNGTWESLSEYIRIKYWITIQMKSAQEEVKIAGIQNGKEFKMAGIQNCRKPTEKEFKIAGSQNRKNSKQQEFKIGIQHSRKPKQKKKSKLQKVKIERIQICRNSKQQEFKIGKS